MKNYVKAERLEEARVELHDRLGLTGAEISVNALPGKTSVPFVHSHKENEEIYYILEGDGKFAIDGEEVALYKGDAIKLVPKAKRELFAGDRGNLLSLPPGQGRILGAIYRRRRHNRLRQPRLAQVKPCAFFHAFKWGFA